jgi:uncharacterized phage protein (TIGR02218 family)
VTYTSLETSAHDGAPIEGFHFIGTTSAWRYTNAQRDVTINGLLYTAAAIKRGGIRSGTQADDGIELEVTLPFSLGLVQTYAFAASPPDLDLTVYRYHESGDPATEWVIVWKGKVTAFSLDGKVAKVRVPSVFELALRGTVPSVFYQGPCNHVLYDARCKVVKALFTKLTTVTVVSADGLSITVADDGFADNFHKAGTLYLPVKLERRLVLSNVANVVGINFPFFNVDVGDDVDLSAGCDHAYQGDCKNKFANTLNHGGYPYVPSDNPFEGSI